MPSLSTRQLKSFTVKYSFLSGALVVYYRTRPAFVHLTLSTIFLLTPVHIYANNIGTNDAAKSLQGANALLQYQGYKQNAGDPPHKIDVAMAPVLGVIKYGLLSGIDPLQLGSLRDLEIEHALTVANNLTPQ